MIRAPTLVALGCVTGCAALYEGKYDWDEGWRVGWVRQLGTGATLAGKVAEECRREPLPAGVAQAPYVEVAYRSEGRWPRYRVVPVPNGMTIKEGQKVYVNLRSCDALVEASSG